MSDSGIDFEFTTVRQSEIGKFRRCKREWFFSAACKLPSPPSEAMQYSSKCHRDVELTLTDPDHEPEYKEVRELRRRDLLPVPTQVLGVERTINDAEYEVGDTGVIFNGTVDAVWRAISNPTAAVVVNDWKFRSTIGRSDADDIRDNDQLNIYASAIAKLLGLGAQDGVILRQTESLKEHKGGPAARAVSVRKTVRELHEFIEENIEPVVREMDRYAERQIRHIPTNKDACFRYGRRCPYWDQCSAISYNPVEPKEEDAVVDDLDDMLDRMDDDADNNETEDEGATNDPVQPPPEADTQSNEEPDDGEDALREAKRDWLDLREELGDDVADVFSIGEYDLEMDERREFVLWRKQQKADEEPSTNEDDSEPELEGANEHESQSEDVDTNETDAPMTPDDQAPEWEPTEPDEIGVEEWDWQQVDYIGPSGEEKIVTWFREETDYRTIGDLIEDGFDFKQVPSISAQKASDIRDAIQAEELFEPDDDATEDGAEKGARELQSMLEDARALVESEGREWNSDLLSGDEVSRCANAQEVANMMVARLDKQGGESDEKTGTNEGGGQPSNSSDLSLSEPDTDSTEPENTYDPGGLKLFVNCHPTHGTEQPEALVTLMDRLGLYDRAVEILATQFDIEVDYWNSADYGKGAKALGAAAMEKVGEFDGRTVTARSDMPGAKEVLAILEPRAELVVKDG